MPIQTATRFDQIEPPTNHDEYQSEKEDNDDSSRDDGKLHGEQLRLRQLLHLPQPDGGGGCRLGTAGGGTGDGGGELHTPTRLSTLTTDRCKRKFEDQKVSTLTTDRRKRELKDQTVELDKRVKRMWAEEELAYDIEFALKRRIRITTRVLERFDTEAQGGPTVITRSPRVISPHSTGYRSRLISSIYRECERMSNQQTLTHVN
jgi:hypothetical protein